MQEIRCVKNSSKKNLWKQMCAYNILYDVYSTFFSGCVLIKYIHGQCIWHLITITQLTVYKRLLIAGILFSFCISFFKILILSNFFVTQWYQLFIEVHKTHKVIDTRTIVRLWGNYFIWEPCYSSWWAPVRGIFQIWRWA